MSIFGFIKNAFKSKEVDPDLVHPVFGKMVAEICGDDDDFWQSEVLFEPLDIEICINVLAGESGPQENQSKFYRSFVSNYELEFDFVSSNLNKEYEDWFQKPLQGSFKDNFKFVGITIPKDGNRNNKWELSFDCLSDKNLHMFSAEIENGEVVNVRADG